jgi:gliding motility-associated-like protein
LICFLFIGFNNQAQLITTNTGAPVDQLVQQALGNDCVEITNVTSSINGSVDGLNSFGSFTRSGSGFPFSEGFFLSTGNGNRIGNNIVNTNLSDGTTAWGGDADLEMITGTTNTVNATVIEFDLVSTANTISFNYLLASEEYQLNFPCNVGDKFALLIRPLVGGTYENIALIPGTSTAVGIDTVHPEVVGECPASNPAFFAGQNLGDTNFEGRTVPLTAVTTVVPNTPYHLKMVIADQSSFDPTAYDSAIFIEAGSLQATVDLGPDLFPCVDALLDADIGNNLATYRWFRGTTELTGETSSTLLANFTGEYRVEITTLRAGTTCIITDVVQVNIDPNQLNVTVTDQLLCDDISGNGFETFNLFDIGNSFLTQLPASNYTTNFYLNTNDAENEINELAASYTNTVNPQTIYVRINDLNTGCQAIQAVNLVVSSNIATDYNYTVCDINDDSVISLDLSLFDSDVALSANSTVTYHLSQNAAENNTGALASPYFFNTASSIIYARVFNNIGNCFDVSAVTVNILLPPSINDEDYDIDACDPDLDGFATFDITSIIPNFTSNTSGMTISYHTSQADADNNVNPIPNPGSFNNTQPERQRVYIRFESTASGCPIVSPVDLYSNRLLYLSNVIDQLACDDPSNDGFEEFDLGSIATSILNGLLNVNIEFFLTEADQLADINQMNTGIPYTNITNPQTLYIRINGPSCTEFEEFDLIVVPPFQSPSIQPQTYCDEDQDLITTIDLSIYDSLVRGTFGNSYSVFYYLTQSDAELEINTVTSVTNTTNPFTVYSGLRDPAGCSSSQAIQITIQPAPVAGTPTGFTICDDDLDGFFIVDLTSQQSQISTDSNRTITFHNTLSDAENSTNAIVDPDIYNAQTETVYVRLENTQTGCETIRQLPIIVNTVPVIPIITEYLICELDGDNIDDFFFSTKDTEILDGQTGRTVRYFTSEANANARVNEIDKFNAYRNTSSPQTIWVRVENDTDITCYAVSSFVLRVDVAPTYNPPADYRICDDDNDGFYTFNLQESIDQIRSGITTNLTVTFHDSALNASTGASPLPLLYTNTLNPQLIYARIGNDVNCFEVEDIRLNIIEIPVTNEVPASVVCDDDPDGFFTFDLTSREAEIVGSRPFNSILSWHNTITDAENDTNPIINESTFTNTTNPQTVYLRYFNILTRCYDIGTLELIVNLDPVLNEINNFVACENDNQIIDLNIVVPVFIDPLPLADFVTSFYTNELDAINAVNPIDTNYNYPSNTSTLFIRVENAITGCFSTGSFILIVEPLPPIAAAGSYDVRICDDNYDGLNRYNLISNNDAILNGLNPAIHNIQFYPTLANAELAINEITNTNVTVNQVDNYFVRVTNTDTGCVSIGGFEVLIDPLPFVNIDSVQVICAEIGSVNVNAATGEPGETYLWSTGETSSNINITVPGAYSVILTNNLGCSSPTFEFNVIASSGATIDFVASTNFSEPNTITVTVNGTGDYRYILDNGPAQLSNVFTNVRRGYHEVQVIDINGCVPSSIQLVLIIDYPRFFTPNNDGFNDTWYVDDIDTFEQATFYIFDRYGKLLKTYGKDFNGWDGMYIGNPLPSSDYWFLLEIVDSRGDFDVRGHFSLKR